MVARSKEIGLAPTEQGFSKPICPQGEGPRLQPLLSSFRIPQLHPGGNDTSAKRRPETSPTQSHGTQQEDSNTRHWQRFRVNGSL